MLESVNFHTFQQGNNFLSTEKLEICFPIIRIMLSFYSNTVASLVLQLVKTYSRHLLMKQELVFYRTLKIVICLMNHIKSNYEIYLPLSRYAKETSYKVATLIGANFSFQFFAFTRFFQIRSISVRLEKIIEFVAQRLKFTSIFSNIS